VVDHQAFLIWKDEALKGYTATWAKIYDGDQASIDFLRECHDSLFVMNIVDNDYVEGDINSIICSFIEAH